MALGNRSGDQSSTLLRSAPEAVHPDYAEHQAGLARGEFVVPECEACRTVQWPPRSVCGRCPGESFRGVQLPLTGQVHTFSVVHRAFHPWFAQQTPYAVAVVTMERDVRSIGFYEGPLEELACELPVTGSILDRGGSPALVWRPGDAS